MAVVYGTRRQDVLSMYGSHRRFKFINAVISFVMGKCSISLCSLKVSRIFQRFISHSIKYTMGKDYERYLGFM